MFLAFLLLVSNIGLAVNVHYCAGEIASVTSGYNTGKAVESTDLGEEACCMELKAVGKKCCSEKVVDLEDTTDDGIVKTFSFQIEMPFVANEWKPLVFSSVNTLQKNQTTSYYCDAHAPPLFKLYSQYILYA